MPKIRRVQSPSVDNCNRAHPYSSNPKKVELHKPTHFLGSVEDLKECEEARCSICMEPPHNAVLLKCSSYEKGCHPYMCNTSYRHSNCLDQFCKSFASHLSSAILQEIPLTGATSRRSSEVCSDPANPSRGGSNLQLKVLCPLCRGEIYGYMVSEPARRYMNSKPRSCSSETCEFQGTYSELRKHARSKHPTVRPSVVDPLRQRDWNRMEPEREVQDVFRSIQASFDTDYRGTDTILTEDFADMLSLFLFEFFSSIEEANLTTLLLDSSRQRLSLHDIRSGTMPRVSDDDTETNQSATRRTSLPSMHQFGIIRSGRRRTRLSSSRDDHPEINRTARWRTNLLSSRTHHEHQYYREGSSGIRLSPTRMPQASQQIPDTNPSGSISSSGRIARHHQLSWRDQRWSRYNNRP